MKFPSTLVKQKRLTVHNGTSHKFYRVKLWGGKAGFKIQAEYGRLGGHATERAKSVKRYTKSKFLTNLIKDREKALKKFNKIIENKKERGYS
jgi:predicted DNA-binding WGR domain protein